MELNFNSVETIPVLNASAAFKVDSGKVFKEDVDIVPVIIDKTLSYVPRGGDNACEKIDCFFGDLGICV